MGGQLQPQAVNRPGDCRYKSWNPSSLSAAPSDLPLQSPPGNPKEVSPAQRRVWRGAEWLRGSLGPCPHSQNEGRPWELRGPQGGPGEAGNRGVRGGAMPRVPPSQGSFGCWVCRVDTCRPESVPVSRVSLGG